MTERPSTHRVHRNADSVRAVGPSALRWDGDSLGGQYHRNFCAVAL